MLEEGTFTRDIRRILTVFVIVESFQVGSFVRLFLHRSENSSISDILLFNWPLFTIIVTSLGVIIIVRLGGVCFGCQDIVYRVAGGLLWRMCDIHRFHAGGGGGHV